MARLGWLEVYRDASRDWRWRLKASNGRIVAVSGEGYRRKSSMIRGIECTRELLGLDPAIAVVEVKK